ncbi:MAG: cyclase family protein [Chloroflexi bacterium]|nr:cyclase family protein [Chloroflexota bacterium]
MLESRALGSLIESARAFDLSVPLFQGMPIHPNHPQYLFSLKRRHGDLVWPGGRRGERELTASGANELIVMTAHSGTHLDALGHVSCDGRCYGGRDAQAIQVGTRGLSELDIASVEPIVCRGVLLDVAGLENVESLPPGYAVTADHLEAAERRQNVKVRAGDAVLINTGWIAHFDDAPRYLGLETGTPGPDESAARWLVDRQVRVTGDDTVTYEVIRAGDRSMPVHPILLVEAGIHIIELMNLAAAAKAGVSECTFVCLPLRIVGGTASPVRPIALV